MKKIYVTLIAVLAGIVSMSAQNNMIVNIDTVSSVFYFYEQAKVSFWGQAKDEEQNGDLTVAVTEVDENYAILTFFLNEASVFSFSDFGKLGAKVLGLYLLTTLISVGVSYGVYSLIRPG